MSYTFPTVAERMRWFTAALMLHVVGVMSVPALAQTARYTFSGQKTAVYEVINTAEFNENFDRQKGYVTFFLTGEDAANGQITLTYQTDFISFEGKVDDLNVPDKQVNWPKIYPRALDKQAIANGPEIILDSSGKVIRANRIQNQTVLKFINEAAWRALLEPVLPDGVPSKTLEKDTLVYIPDSKKSQGPKGTESLIELPATETVTYTLAGNDNGLITTKKKYLLATNEKVGGQPKYQKTGEGNFVFDAKKGVMKSAVMSYFVTINTNNTSIRLPVDFSMRLLSANEMAEFEQKLKADEERQKAAIQSMEYKRRASQMPEGMKKTQPIGGQAPGLTFVNVNPKKLPVLGFRYALNRWGDQTMVQFLEPIYDPAGESVPAGFPDGKLIVAKPGYAVAGLEALYGQDGIYSFKVVFAKLSGDKLDMSDKYTSDSPLTVRGTNAVTLGCTGGLVYGIAGSQSFGTMNVSLVMAVTAEELEAQNKLTEAVRSGKSTDLLPAMQGYIAPSGGGEFILQRGQRLTSPLSFKVPVTFKMEVDIQNRDLRLDYAANQVIFNWEMNPDELRIDGGPASGAHKRDFGQLPTGQWVTIEWVVLPDKMLIYINGKERYQAAADFSLINKPLAITAHGGPVKVKSLSVVKSDK